MPNKETLLRYAWLKTEISKLESEMEMMKDLVLEEVLAFKALQDDMERPVELTEYPGYTFSIQQRKTWDYPEYVKMAEKHLKEEKQEAQHTGAATFTEKQSVIFNPPKE